MGVPKDRSSGRLLLNQISRQMWMYEVEPGSVLQDWLAEACLAAKDVCLKEVHNMDCKDNGKKRLDVESDGDTSTISSQSHQEGRQN